MVRDLGGNNGGLMPQTILVTGGAGYVGSHVVAALLAAGHRPVVLNDLSNAPDDIAGRLAGLGGEPVDLVVGDIRDASLLDATFRRVGFDAVVHLAGLKSVGESLAEPLRYVDVNVGGTVALLAAMQRHRVRPIVFSSSATVYGTSAANPIGEDAPLGPLSPYGRTKATIETMLADVVAAEPEMAAISLRYFNPVGAHPSGLIGESPRGVPNNLFPFIAETAAGRRERVLVYGADYPTADGTGVRDFVHVMHLAQGHLDALEFLLAGSEGLGRHVPVNLGCGRGYSVLEAIAAFGRAVGRPVPHTIAQRRAGDVAECVADVTRAARLLGWQAQRGLDEMCRDHWAFEVRRSADQAGMSTAAAWERTASKAAAAAP
jgi:UDP-glucose 4-epimerase